MSDANESSASFIQDSSNTSNAVPFHSFQQDHAESLNYWEDSALPEPRDRLFIQTYTRAARDVCIVSGTLNSFLNLIIPGMSRDRRFSWICHSNTSSLRMI